MLGRTNLKGGVVIHARLAVMVVQTGGQSGQYYDCGIGYVRLSKSDAMIFINRLPT